MYKKFYKKFKIQLHNQFTKKDANQTVQNSQNFKQKEIFFKITASYLILQQKLQEIKKKFMSNLITSLMECPYTFVHKISQRKQLKQNQNQN
ncbi:unnamed protein product [Paramecium sonneborni]|uniref:Uncharacterized protein n=1 Tax=Paramecium sonneborni TaxID=65129 RepID=A0A8S1QPN6_9CILI|nr:unnamed protein product [Paramecium sonneborni]